MIVILDEVLLEMRDTSSVVCNRFQLELLQLTGHRPDGAVASMVAKARAAVPQDDQAGRWEHVRRAADIFSAPHLSQPAALSRYCNGSGSAYVGLLRRGGRPVNARATTEVSGISNRVDLSGSQLMNDIAVGVA